MSSKRSKRASSPSGSEGDSSRSSSPAPPKAKSHKRRRSVSRSRSRSVSPASSASSSSSDSGSESDGGFLGEAPAPPRARRPEAAAAASPPSDNLRELRALVERSPPSSSPAASKQSKKKKPAATAAAAASGAPHRVTHSKTVGTVIGLAAGDPINRDTIKIGRLVDFGGQRYVMTEMPRTGFHPCPPKVDADGAKKSVGVAKFPSSADAAMHKHHISAAPLIDNDPKKPDLSRRESIVVCSDGGAHLVSASLGRVMVNNSVKSSDIKGWKTYASRLDFLIRENLTGGSTNDKCKHAIVPWSTYYSEKKAAADGKAGAADDEGDGPMSVAPSAAAATAPAPKGGRRRPAAASASAAAAAQGATHVSLAAHLEMADCYLRRPIQKYMQAEAERAHQSMSVMAKSWKQTCIDKLSPLDEQAATAHWKGVTAIECACQIVLFMTPEGGRLLDKWIADLTEQETRSYKLESAIMGAPPVANDDKAEKAGVEAESDQVEEATAEVKVEKPKIEPSSSDDGDEYDPSSRKMQPKGMKSSSSSKKSSKSKRVKSEDEEEEEERPLSKKEKRDARRELKAAKKAKKEHRKKKKRRTEKKETSGDDDDDDEKKKSAQTPPASESDAASDTEMAAAAVSSSEEAESGADASDAVSDSE